MSLDAVLTSGTNGWTTFARQSMPVKCPDAEFLTADGIQREGGAFARRGAAGLSRNRGFRGCRVASLAIMMISVTATLQGSNLPPIVRDAMTEPDHLDLLSLYPGPPGTAPERASTHFYGFLILGRTTVTDRAQQRNILATIERGDAENDGTVAACFSPRHGLHVQSGDTVVDLVICFECLHMNVYVDGAFFASVNTSPGPQVLLDRLLRESRVPLGGREQAPEAGEAERRWVVGMPTVLRPLWESWRNHVLRNGSSPDLLASHRILEENVPNESTRIRALLGWYGSGQGSWSDYPEYEDLAREHLLYFPTSTLLEAIEEMPLASNQIEGAARLFADEHFVRSAPQDLTLLPSELKRILLEHCVDSGSDEKRIAAIRAFGY